MIHPINCLRLLISQWRGERWIKTIWRWLNQNEPYNLQWLKDLYFKKGVTYLMFNTQTKKMIVGSTSDNLYKRFSRHISGRVDNLSKKAANYIKHKGPHLWMIIPLAFSDNRNELYKLEGIWANRLRNYLINNPIQMHQQKPTKKPTKKKRERDLKRIPQLKETIFHWRSYIHIIHHTEEWKNWDKLAMINLLINLKKARIPLNLERDISHKIRLTLNKIHHFKLKPFYLLKLPTTTDTKSRHVKSWIKKYLQTHYTDAYSNYVANHLRISTESTMKLNTIIDNSKAILHKYSHFQNKEECHCNKYQELIQPDHEHVNIRAQDLPDKWNILKDILTTTNKAPVTLPYSLYLGITFDKIRKFLDDNQLYRKWSSEENERLYKIVYRPKGHSSNLLLDRLTKIMKPLQKHLGFVTLDKNNNTWNIICRKHYIDLHQKEFQNTKYYGYISNNPKRIMNRIEEKYKEMVLPNCKQKFITKRQWKLSRAYLLPKNKDQNKTRPIVSYFNHYSKNLGEKIARALMIMIKTLTLKWDTCELHNINDVNP